MPRPAPAGLKIRPAELRRHRPSRAGEEPIQHPVARLALPALLVVASLAAAPCFGQGGELGVNVYGLSYHFERDRAKELGFDNEVNPGVGLRYRFPRQDFDWFVDGGAYRDSGRNTAVYAGAGAFWKIGERLRLGAALAFFHSDTYNDGDAFIAPLPLAAYEWRHVTLNLVYFPKVSSINDVNVLGFWITLWPKAF